MTNEEFAAKEAELLKRLPVEFRSKVSYAAYERGHSYGMEEVLSYVEGYVDMLEEPIQDYRIRIREEVLDNQ